MVWIRREGYGAGYEVAKQDRAGSAERGVNGRVFILSSGFLVGTVTGIWLGLVAAFFSGLASSVPDRFPSEDLAATTVVAGGVLWAASVLVKCAGGEIELLARDRPEGNDVRHEGAGIERGRGSDDLQAIGGD